MKIPSRSLLLWLVCLQFPLQAQVLIDADFNTPGTTAKNGGTWKGISLRGADGQPADLHTADGGGASGQPGDRAFDNSKVAPNPGGRPLGSRGTMAKQNLAASAVTLAGWFKQLPASPGRGRQTLFILQSGPDRGLQLSATPSDGILELTVNGKSAKSSPLLAAEGEWAFLAAVYDSAAPEDQVKFFKGGPDVPVAQAGSASLAAGPLDVQDASPVLGNVGGRSAPFPGLIDNFHFEAAALDTEALEGLRRAAMGGGE